MCDDLKEIENIKIDDLKISQENKDFLKGWYESEEKGTVYSHIHLNDAVDALREKYV